MLTHLREQALDHPSHRPAVWEGPGVRSHFHAVQPETRPAPALRSVRRTTGIACVLALLLTLPLATGAQTPLCTENSPAITGTGYIESLDALVADCNTLLGLKDALRNTASLNWAADVAMDNSMDTWEGVTVEHVEGVPRVTVLDLGNKQLDGGLPSTLGALTGLKSIFLSDNALTGGIPSELGDLPNLERLWLNNNALTGSIPSDLGKLGDQSNLESLLLNNNALAGSIPSDLGDLSNLKQIFLYNNTLTGSIPSDLGKLSNLEELVLNGNALTGSIPSDLGKLSNLRLLLLNNNQLTGDFPSEISTLTKLEYLYLWGNHLTGEIPNLDKLANLERLYLSSNHLTGEIPDLSTLDNLQWLLLSNNHLTGAFPDHNKLPASLTYLYLSSNPLLAGALPDFSQLPALAGLSIYDTQWTGTLPSGGLNPFQTNRRPVAPDASTTALTLDVNGAFTHALLFTDLDEHSLTCSGQTIDGTALTALTVTTTAPPPANPTQTACTLSGPFPPEETVLTVWVTDVTNTATNTVPDGSPALEAYATVTLTPASTTSATTIATTSPTISVSPNHPPRFLGRSERLRFIAENLPVGTHVGAPIVATDPDIDATTPPSATLRYTLSGADASPFTITATGQIQTQAILDYEHPADADSNNAYEVTVTATDSSGVSAETAVTIYVTDVDVAISPPTLAFSESGSGSYTIVLDTQPTGHVTITPTSSDPTVATVSPVSLTFTPTDWATEQPVTVSGVNDFIVNVSPRTATMTHSVSGGDYTGVPVAAVAVTLSDDDTRGVTISPPTLPVPENGSGTYTIVLNTQPTGNVTITPASSAPTVATVSGPLTFGTTDWATPQPVTVSGVDDAIDNVSPRTATMTHSISGGDYTGVPVAAVAVTLSDDDTRGVTISPPTLPVPENGSGSYTIKLDTQPTGAVTITPASSAPGVATVSGSLTFGTADWATPKPVTVSGVDDAIDNVSPRTATMTHSVSGGDYGSVSAAAVAVTLSDNDTRGVTISPRVLEFPENEERSYTVVLNTEPTDEVTITLTSSAPTVATVSPVSLTFDPTDWDEPQPVTVTGVPDSGTADRPAGITHSVSGGDYTGVPAASVGLVVTHVASAPVTPNLGGGSGGSGGSSGGGGSDEDEDEAPPALVGRLENPGPDSFQSGIGVLSGWVCEAAAVELVIEPAQGEPARHGAAYGTERLDTAEVCGDVDNGFGVLVNWNRLGAGAYTVTAFVDGVELAQATVTVTTLGEEFLRGAEGECVVADFPTVGESVQLVWQERSQNFAIAGAIAPTAAPGPGSPLAGFGALENPGPNSFQSGIGVLSGWVCEAEGVEFEIVTAQGERERHGAAYGTERLDTAEVCGDVDNGFGLLVNWNRLGAGEHTVTAVVDGVELGQATVRVTTLGAEFLQDVAGECVVEDFPTDGQTVRLVWQERSQNFVVGGRE